MGCRMSTGKAGEEDGRHGHGNSNRGRAAGFADVEEENSRRASAQGLPLLYALSQTWAWAAVTHRAGTHPHEADPRHVDTNGDTLLHWACFGNPPLEPIVALLTASPRLARVLNNRGHNPLYVACSFRTRPDVIRALLDAYPEAALVQVRKRTPLFVLCGSSPCIDSMRAILETTEGLQALQQAPAKYHPLEVLFRKHRHLLYKLCDTMARSLDHVRTGQVVISSQIWNALDEITLLVRAEYTARPFPPPSAATALSTHYFAEKNTNATTTPSILAANSTTRGHHEQHPHDGFYFLHAFTAIVSRRRIITRTSVSPSLLIHALIMLNPLEVQLCDFTGRLPLQVSIEEMPCSAVVGKTKMGIEFMRRLLWYYPSAAAMPYPLHPDGNSNNELPLMKAVGKFNEQHGLNRVNSIDILIKAHAPAVHSLELDWKLYPRVLESVATSRWCEENDGLSTVYEILKSKPCICFR